MAAGRSTAGRNGTGPPLGKLIIATGLAFTDTKLDPAFTGDQTQLGRHILYESGNNPKTLLLAARLPVIVLTLLFGLVTFLFARDLTTPTGGLTALALYTFSPDLIAHGALATLDVPVAGFVLTATWLLWRARANPGRYVPLAGLALGAAVATKMSALAAVPVLLILAALATQHRKGPKRTLRAAAAVATVALLAIAVVWAAYLTVDPRLHWTTPPDLRPQQGLRALADALPLPRPYLDGLRVQFALEDRTWSTFLLGTYHPGPVWYYLPTALLIKLPLGALALGTAGAATMLTIRGLRPAAPYVLLPAVVLLATAMTSTRDLGVRYAIFVPMFLAVAAGTLVLIRSRWTHLAVAALVVFAAISSLRTFPYYLTYSNEAFGGPSRTHLSLHDSNVDWGQDLARLADRYPGEKIWLVYKGSGVPSAYGITATDPRDVPPAQVHGLLAVSDSAIAKADERLTTLISTSTPIDDVGHSITIYRRP
ncbi:glycosyltransferase family 39 protein [Amycolatopsis sp. OK19-0408]|uniref:Glycosyltransferase family 39 protein n=1 Tax=Amycolatopsis iheyensis TaxID=2945988 RepID=A0A9X2N8I3_9PSEU|nr:glycosyltransferase family 39 protein [Amycolatopsis iheyensis]MCR6482848.1 glycosyltransferase family 39 protein [Amycolatopsis iheyensis]